MNKKRVEIHHFVFFLIHFSGCLYVFRSGVATELQHAAQWLPVAYASIGFRWTEPTAGFISLAVQMAFLLNILRRVTEGFIFGWPRFSSHDQDSFRHAWVRVVAYSAFVILSVGAFGVLRSEKPADLIDMFLIAIVTFVFGAIADLWDEAISATVVIIKRGKR